MTDRQSAAHILRRLTFGPTAPEVDRAVKDGVPTLLAPVPPPAPPDLGPDPLGALPKGASREDRVKARQAANDQVGTLTRWWLARMAAPGAAEKLTFFWHGHWATSVQKVKSAQLMLAQQQAFRRYGPGDTGAFVRAMLRDPALIIWLDGQKNTAKAPNENLARELMELFTLGVGNYTEDDVKAGARALTGWVVDRSTGAARFLPKRHSPGAPDADAHADSLVRNPAHARFIATRLWVRYGSGAAPSAATAQRLVSAFGPGRDVTAMLTALTADPEFPATDGQLVKQPVEWLLGATRQLGIDPAKIPVAALRALGQVLFRPPSVGGWPVGEAWLTTSATQARLKYGQGLAVLAPAAVQTLTEAAKADRLDALGRLLVVDKWTDRTAAVLAPAAAKPQRLLALGLATPEYAVH
jgi:uncharacterized protein (DUF1800 family)